MPGILGGTAASVPTLTPVVGGDDGTGSCVPLEPPAAALWQAATSSSQRAAARQAIWWLFVEIVLLF
jgi:hypothetical protein